LRVLLFINPERAKESPPQADKKRERILFFFFASRAFARDILVAAEGSAVQSVVKYFFCFSYPLHPRHPCTISSILKSK
jgi:hypothetical protein